MKIATSFLTFIFILNYAFAFSPGNTATLFQHLSEVNRQWHTKTLEEDLQDEIAFSSDKERIAVHLQLVEKYLRRADLNIAPEKLKKRAKLLDVLKEYRLQEDFPVNTFHGYRIPYFIDIYGTACAVGYLMIESGHAELASKVKREGNFRYIHEIKYPELVEWADAHGFSIDELAWIQPAYQSHINFKAIGDGVNGEVEHVICISTDPLLILLTGNFTQAGDVPLKGIAIWNGNNYYNPFTGVEGKVENYFESVYGMVLSGNFTRDNSPGNFNLLVYKNDSIWYLQNIGHISSVVTAYYEPYAAGYYDDSISRNYFLLRKINNRWHEIAKPDGRINSIVLNNFKIYFGGEFTNVDSIQVNYIAAYNPSTDSIEALDNGLDAPVKILRAYGHRLYAGGIIQDENRERKFGLASWINDHWQFLLGSTNYNFYNTSESYIKAIEPFAEGLTIGGKFNVNTSNWPKHIARYYFLSGNLSYYGNPNGPVNSIFVDKDQHVYIGGDFSNYGFFAELDNSTGINFSSRDNIKVYPNPATDKFIVQFDQSIVSPSIKLFSVHGRLMNVECFVADNEIHVNRAGLSSGVYYVQIISEDKIMGNLRLVFL